MAITSKPFRHQRDPNQSFAIRINDATNATTVTTGDQRRKKKETASPRGVCGLKGWMIQTGVITIASPATTTNASTIHAVLRLMTLRVLLVVIYLRASRCGLYHSSSRTWIKTSTGRHSPFGFEGESGLMSRQTKVECLVYEDENSCWRTNRWRRRTRTEPGDQGFSLSRL